MLPKINPSRPSSDSSPTHSVALNGRDRAVGATSSGPLPFPWISAAAPIQASIAPISIARSPTILTILFSPSHHYARNALRPDPTKSANSAKWDSFPLRERVSPEPAPHHFKIFQVHHCTRLINSLTHNVSTTSLVSERGRITGL